MKRLCVAMLDWLTGWLAVERKNEWEIEKYGFSFSLLRFIGDELSHNIKTQIRIKNTTQNNQVDNDLKKAKKDRVRF